ncbi:MAG: response regulator transcription factor [Burkholderiaceae bacterium]
MRALWIEDQKLIADALRDHLNHVMPDVSLDLAQDIESAVQLAGVFHYQLVMLDWWLKAENGETALRRLKAAGCTAPVIVVSGDDRDSVKRRALTLGAVAYVAKGDEPETLVQAIRSAMNGFVTPSAPGPLLSDAELRPPAPRLVNIQTAFPELTARQAEVFTGLVRGVSDKQIARELGISDTTVKTHVKAILQTVGVGKRGMAAYAAVARGVGGL